MGTDLWYHFMYGACVRRVWSSQCTLKDQRQTFTLPLEIDALYMSGTDTSITSAFAVSSILVIIAVIVLILRNIFEYRSKNSKGIQ